MPLTGRFYFRRTVLGKVALMVEEEKERTWPLSWNGKTRKRWRDASLMDLTHHELRKILELQDKFSTSVNEPRDDGPSHKNAYISGSFGRQSRASDQSAMRQRTGTEG